MKQFECTFDDEGPEEFKQAGENGHLQGDSVIGWIDLSASDFGCLRNGCIYRINPAHEAEYE